MKNEPLGDYLECLFDSDEQSIQNIHEVSKTDNMEGGTLADVMLEDESVPTRRPCVLYLAEDGPVSLRSIAALVGSHFHLLGGFPVGEPREDATTITLEGGEDRWENGVMANANGYLINSEIDYTIGPDINFFFSNFFENGKALSLLEEKQYKLSAWAFSARFQELSDFSLKGQEAIDWLAKVGKEPTYDESGNVRPLNFSFSELVTYFPETGETPDFGRFTSPVHNVEEITAFGMDLYRMGITIINHDGFKVDVTLYAKRSFFDHKPEEGENVQGVLWLQGQLVNDLEGEALGSMNDEATSAYHFMDNMRSFPFGKGFNDLMPLMSPIDNIKIRDGYVLDAFICGDEKNISIYPYVCADGSEWMYEPKIENGKCVTAFDDRMYIQGRHPKEICACIPPVEEYLEGTLSAESVWEAYLLRSLKHLMPRSGEEKPKRWKMIYSNWWLPNDMEHDFSPFYNDERLKPVVEINQESASIACPYWSDEQGLFIEAVSVVVKDGRFIFSEPVIHQLLPAK